MTLITKITERYFLFKTIIAVFIISPVATLAQEQSEDHGLWNYKKFLLDENGEWSLGIGATVRNSPFKGEKISAIPVPIIDYSSKNLFIRGVRAGYHIKKVDNPRIGGFFTDGYFSPRFRPGDSRKKISLDAGLSAGYQSPVGTISLSVEQDITNASNGTLLGANYSFTFVTKNRKHLLIPIIGITWQNQKLANYLWGIDQETFEKTLNNPDETTLNPYTVTGAVLNYTAGITHVYRIDDHWNTMINAKMTILDNDILKNPVVERQYDYSFILGTVYTF